MKITKLIAALLLGLAVTGHAKDLRTPATSQYIGRLVGEAIAKHPKVQAAEARSQAASQAMGAIRLWEDPEWGLGLTAASRSMRQDNGDIRLGVDQGLPNYGLYRAEVRRTSADQQIRQAERRLAASEIGLAVATTIIELALTDDTLGLQDEEIGWLHRIVTTARERSKNPDATAVEPLRLESELAVRTQERESGRRRRAQIARTLNLLLLREAGESWPALTVPEGEPAPASAAAIRAEMERHNPRLEALRHQVESATAESEAFRARSRPSIGLGLETNTYSGGEFRDAIFALRMSLPWFNRAAYKADVARSEDLRRAAECDLAAMAREFEVELTALITEVENQSRLAAAYRNDVLPKSEKATESVLNAWVSSKATLLEVLDSRRALLEVRLQQKRAAAARLAALQSLSALTGALGQNPIK